jgi:hypothetical protein
MMVEIERRLGTVLNPHHLIQALQAAGADHNVAYLSVPVTSGPREVDLLNELGLTSPQELRSVYGERWRHEVVQPNEQDAATLANTIRRASWARGKVLVDPSRIHIDGWDQDDYNAFWISLMTEHAIVLVASSGWTFSRGARGEVGYALALNLEVVDVDGRSLDVDTLMVEAERARQRLRESGWPQNDVERYLPPVNITDRPCLQPSAQSEVFYWLGQERHRQIELFGADEDDANTRATGLDCDGWWSKQLRRYWREAKDVGLDTARGRLLLARYVATGCGLLESVVRVHGPLPEPLSEPVDK